MSTREEWNKARITKSNDKRIKFTEDKKILCDQLYFDGVSITQIAKTIQLNKRTIQFYLFPERLDKNKQLREDRGGWKQYYDTDKNNTYSHNYRNHLVELNMVTRKKSSSN